MSERWLKVFYAFGYLIGAAIGSALVLSAVVLIVSAALLVLE